MRLLLDTQLLLWSLGHPKKLGRSTRALLDRCEVFVSAASIWEISMKAALGKLRFKPSVVLRGIEPAGFSFLPIRGEHAARVYDLGLRTADPFDRLLVAQALSESLTLLTNDAALAVYGDVVQVID
jgi:PIN domain nuclease of toxin-antitoxin system